MKLTQQQLEAHLWGAANILRGKTAGQDYKNYILSLMFYKRLCDQWENEADEAIADLERQQGRTFSEAQKAVFRARGEHRFLIPEGSRWGDVLATSINLGRKLTAAMRAVASANEELRGGMLVHCADYLREGGHHATMAQYFGQEMNWGNAAIGKINSVLHGLEAQIAAGTSTITDPAFRDEEGKVRRFSLVLANFPFSDDFWWLKPEQQTDDAKKKAKLKQQVFGKEGYKDPLHRFGRGTPFPAPPASTGDYAFILHILASLNAIGRAGIVCPQGVLFRGQPAIEEETGDFDADGNPKFKRRKADDEHLIRRALVEARLIDAVISLPLNCFYGAGVPACLLILRRKRPPERHGQLLLVYAARHYRELSNQNELRPQDVMRILVLAAIEAKTDAANRVVLALTQLKKSLMHDLLTGTVRVTGHDLPPSP